MKTKYLASVIAVLAAWAVFDSTRANAVTEAEPTTLSERVAAETIEKTGVQFGVQLGAALSEAQTTGAASNRGGVAGGVVADIPLIEFLRLQTELNYVQRGARTTAFGGTTSARLHNLELPVLLKFEPEADLSVRPFLLVGPKVAYLLDASSDAGNVRRETFSSWDAGLEIGGGLAFGVGDHEAFLTARYSAGLVDIDPSAREWRSQSAQLLAGILF